MGDLSNMWDEEASAYDGSSTCHPRVSGNPPTFQFKPYVYGGSRS